MKRALFSAIVALVFTLAFAMPALANIPPPPVNQVIGIPDTTFNNLIEADCRFCHEDPNIGDDENIPNRHHLLVGTAVPSGTCAQTGDPCERNTDCPGFDPTVPGGAENACSVHTDRPYPSGDTTGNYDCFSCHQLVWDPVLMSFVLETFRDCTFCHIQDPLAATTHHATTKAKNNECIACHGPITDPRTDPVTGAFLDGHTIPTYQPSLVTPCMSYTACGSANYKTVNNLPPGDPDATGGFCTFCHAGDVNGVTDPDFIGVFGPVIPVVSIAAAHHSTGLISAPFDDLGQAQCNLCHNVIDPDPADIRRCETCHGFQSLHNIQVDSPAVPTGTIDPGAEDPWWGHIGNNSDCHGCHGFSAANAPGAGPIIPDVGLLSSYDIVAGTGTSITIYGNAFTNEIMGNLVTSNVELTTADGSTTVLTPDSISESSMEVTIPGTLATGNYTLRAVKGSSRSNASVIAVIPGVTITDTSCSKKKGVLTINGSGFDTKPEGTDADINVEVNGKVVDLISWSDTQIKASISSCSKSSTIIVNALYGSATSGDNNGGGKPDKPCKGKKCQ
jgi:hypothetical protein